jgi:HAD superfamily hydrolase (TIGR01509 family)
LDVEQILSANGRPPTAIWGQRGRWRLIIFDKDGTLLDFQAMWGGWAQQLGARLSRGSGKPVTAALLREFGYDPERGVVDPDGRLAHAPMSLLYETCEAVLREAGASAVEAREIVQAAWRLPDPATAVPLTDLATLFAALKTAGLQIAIATSDNQAAAVAAMTRLGVADWLDAIIGADQGFAAKPSPEMVHYLCDKLGVAPEQTIMVGDTPADMLMGRAAGVGLVVGVLSGTAAAAALEPLADLVLPSVADLVPTADDRRPTAIFRGGPRSAVGGQID